MKFLQPEGWPAPKGYANGILAKGVLLVTGGIVGWNAAGDFESDDFVDQTRQALANIVAVLESGGAKPEHLVRLTWYITDRKAYLENLKEVGRAYRDTIGRHFPAMAMVEVSALMNDRAKVEIEATAVVPES